MQQMTETEVHILIDKELRKDIDEVIQKLKANTQKVNPNPAPDEPRIYSRQSRERSLALTKLQEAVMWLGMDLKDLGNPSPYPNSYIKNIVVDKTADGLKL